MSLFFSARFCCQILKPSADYWRTVHDKLGLEASGMGSITVWGDRRFQSCFMCGHSLLLQDCFCDGLLCCLAGTWFGFGLPCVLVSSLYHSALVVQCFDRSECVALDPCCHGPWQTGPREKVGSAHHNRYRNRNSMLCTWLVMVTTSCQVCTSEPVRLRRRFVVSLLICDCIPTPSVPLGLTGCDSLHSCQALFGVT